LLHASTPFAVPEYQRFETIINPILYPFKNAAFSSKCCEANAYRAAPRYSKEQKRRPGPKDAVSGGALFSG
jgi:hypothetical protein